MKQIYSCHILAVVLFISLCMIPAAAVIQEVTVKGVVSNISPIMGTITISNPLQYGCTYAGTGTATCSYSPMATTALTGSVPGDSVFTLLKPGDSVVATSLGGAGGTWIAVAKLYGPGQTGEFVTDLVGEPSSIPTPFVGDYALDTLTYPDCTSCSGTTCTADSADVNLKSSGTLVSAKTLDPRQALVFNGRNDGSSVDVTFVKGQASSVTCVGRTGMTGPQPISVFVVKIVPPIGFGAKSLPPPTPVVTATQPPTPVPTTKSGSFPLIVIAGLGVAALVLAARKP